MSNVLQADVWVSGLGQGVDYRGVTQAKARQWGLAGWVRNLLDG